jgi:taurine dioxygenase
MLQVQPLSPEVGAIISGVDIQATLAPDTVRQIRQAVLDHGAVVFRGQDLSREEMQAFMENFGTVSMDPFGVVPEQPVAAIDTIVDMHTLPYRRATSVWHIDSSLAPAPASLIALRAVTIPPVGGDTCFSSMYAAYETLSEPLRDMLDGLSAVHSSYKVMPLMSGADYGHLQEDMRNVHPVVRVHPETGRKALFVDELWTEAIVELTPDESAHLLGFLFEHIKKPDFSIRWHWAPHDIVLWDNRSMQHYAIPDYYDTRVLQKVILKGDRPYGPYNIPPS